MAHTAKGAIFARVTTKTIFMKFKKLRIIQAGLTTNFGMHEGGEYPLSITDAAVKSVVALGNLKPIHCRRTHNGSDMLDGYLGKFTNFVYENGAAFADFEMSEALETAYPNEAKFIATMIEKEYRPLPRAPAVPGRWDHLESATFRRRRATPLRCRPPQCALRRPARIRPTWSRHRLA